jgi:hypothetical protein
MGIEQSLIAPAAHVSMPREFPSKQCCIRLLLMSIIWLPFLNVQEMKSLDDGTGDCAALIKDNCRDSFAVKHSFLGAGSAV